MNHQTPIADIMTRQVITLDPLDTFDKVEAIFEQKNIHHIPIVDQHDKVLGIISKSDYHSLCDRYTLFSKTLGDRINKSYFASLLTQDVMHKNPVCLKETDGLAMAIGIFQENLFHGMPIVNDEKQITGILTTLDVINYLNVQVGSNNTCKNQRACQTSKSNA